MLVYCTNEAVRMSAYIIYIVVLPNLGSYGVRTRLNSQHVSLTLPPEVINRTI